MNQVNRSQFVKGTDFKQNIVVHTGNSCYIPKSGNCFIKGIKYSTGNEYTEVFLTFIPDVKRRTHVKSPARVQQVCKNI